MILSWSVGEAAYPFSLPRCTLKEDMPGSPFSLLALVLGLAFLAWAFSLAGTVGAPSGTVNYTTFLEDLKAGRVKEVVVRAGDTRIQGVLEDGSAFTTYAASPPDNATLEGWMARG